MEFNYKWEVIDQTDPKPSDRADNAFIQKDELLYFFGGNIGGYTNETWKFNLITREWANITKAIRPVSRIQHSFVRVGNYGYMFGGTTGSLRNDTWKFNLFTEEWSQISTAIQPSSRRAHKVIAYNNSIYLFGGTDGGNSSQLWKFDTLAETWENITPVNNPIPGRYHHCMFLYNQKIYVTFGLTTSNFIFNDLWEYDIATEEWREIAISTKPLGRWGAGHVRYGYYHYFFGGSTDGGVNNRFNDLWRLDIRNETWANITLSQNISTMASTLLHEFKNRIYLFFGYLGPSTYNGNIYSLLLPNPSFVKANSKILRLEKGNLTEVTEALTSQTYEDKGFNLYDLTKVDEVHRPYEQQSSNVFKANIDKNTWLSKIKELKIQ